MTGSQERSSPPRRPVGERTADDAYPEGGINGLVEDGVRRLAGQLRTWPGSDGRRR